jgi:hypothetical protein
MEIKTVSNPIIPPPAPLRGFYKCQTIRSSAFRNLGAIIIKDFSDSLLMHSINVKTN